MKSKFVFLVPRLNTGCRIGRSEARTEETGTYCIKGCGLIHVLVEESASHSNTMQSADNFRLLPGMVRFCQLFNRRFFLPLHSAGDIHGDSFWLDIRLGVKSELPYPKPDLCYRLINNSTKVKAKSIVMLTVGDKREKGFTTGISILAQSRHCLA